MARKQNEVGACEHCEKLKTNLQCERMAHDAQMGRLIRRDTEVINGLLREIDALHLLLEKERKHGDEHCDDSGNYIHNCQDMKP